MRAACAVSLLCLVSSRAFAQAVPTGFTDEAVISTGLTQPTAMAFLPDGRILITEQTLGQVKIWAGSGSPVVVGTVAGLASSSEQGLLALAVDPQWPTRPYIYTWSSRLSPNNQVLSMFTMTGQLTNPTSTAITMGARYDIITDVPDNAFNHNGGSVRFGPDGMLYVSMGEDADACNAQVVGSFKGCILRLNVASLPGAGAGPPAKTLITPAGNPFTSPSPNGPLVWAYGLRNPFRFHIDPPTGWLFIADVGQNAMEEIDVCTLGGRNFGWPWMEGTLTYSAGCGGTQPAGLTAPIATMTATSGAHSIMSAGRYRNPGPALAPFAFGASYEGDYFFLDYWLGAMRRLQLSGSTWVAAPAVAGQPNSTDWGTGFTNVCDAAPGADGALYYVKQSPASVRRIKGSVNAPLITVTQGNNQVGNAGSPLLQPIQFHLTQLGIPVIGHTITFSVTAGVGSFAYPTAVTDIQGNVTCDFTPGTTSTVNPVITATGDGVSATASVTWRGLTVVVIPASHFVTATFRHSATNSPFTLALDAPVAVPYFQTPYGAIFTSVFNSFPTCVALDGLGLVGPADPNIHTQAATAVWTLNQSNLPTYGNLVLKCQAYAIDGTRWPNPDCYVISNTVQITLP